MFSSTVLLALVGVGSAFKQAAFPNANGTFMPPFPTASGVTSRFSTSTGAFTSSHASFPMENSTSVRPTGFSSYTVPPFPTGNGTTMSFPTGTSSASGFSNSTSASNSGFTVGSSSTGSASSQMSATSTGSSATPSTTGPSSVFFVFLVININIDINIDINNNAKRQLGTGSDPEYIGNDGFLTTNCDGAANFFLRDDQLFNTRGGQIATQQGTDSDPFVAVSGGEINTTFAGTTLSWRDASFDNGAAKFAVLNSGLVEAVFVADLPAGSEESKLIMTQCPSTNPSASVSQSAASQSAEIVTIPSHNYQNGSVQYQTITLPPYEVNNTATATVHDGITYTVKKLCPTCAPICPGLPATNTTLTEYYGCTSCPTTTVASHVSTCDYPLTVTSVCHSCPHIIVVPTTTTVATTCSTVTDSAGHVTVVTETASHMTEPYASVMIPAVTTFQKSIVVTETVECTTCHEAVVTDSVGSTCGTVVTNSAYSVVGSITTNSAGSTYTCPATAAVTGHICPTCPVSKSQATAASNSQSNAQSHAQSNAESNVQSPAQSAESAAASASAGASASAVAQGMPAGSAVAAGASAHASAMASANSVAQAGASQVAAMSAAMESASNNAVATGAKPASAAAAAASAASSVASQAAASASQAAENSAASQGASPASAAMAGSSAAAQQSAAATQAAYAAPSSNGAQPASAGSAGSASSPASGSSGKTPSSSESPLPFTGAAQVMVPSGVMAGFVAIAALFL